ncbi:small GTP-binding protein [Tritrichomonas foetus]|uniref:Small GTP-binding protein n=1 Tax=Tritrichomonas foetus TaxID=1144522 RepID=A0A1J4KS07_9EUKA|nr:small GTP-binding protein [Tritrichomonas foetus]|eukprot:OHT12604.1 small GTP-binding protein [Tritrichomonas foetus]
MIDQSCPPELSFRIVTIGDSSVGKTSIINRLIHDKFSSNEPGTIGANYQQYYLDINQQRIEMQIWDTAGQEKYRALMPIYFRRSHAALIVYASNNEDSFNHLPSFIHGFQDVVGTDTVIYIVGNKCDLYDNMTVDYSTAEEWATQHGFKFFKTSALTGEGIKEMLRVLGEELLTRKNNITKELKPEVSNSDKCC